MDYRNTTMAMCYASSLATDLAHVNAYEIIGDKKFAAIRVAESIATLRIIAAELGFDLVQRLTAKELIGELLVDTDDRRADARLANVGGGRI